MTQNRPTLALCMIVRDEVENLPKSLYPVRKAFDEIVVIDTGSADDTKELARSYGAKVLSMPWTNDFSQARNASVRAAQSDWIVWLDADNYLSPAGVDTLRERLTPERNSIIWCTEVVVPDGDRLLQKRVFPRRPEVYFSGRVHEQLVHPPDYRSVFTLVDIVHWGYADRAAARAKGERNLALLEDMVRQQPDEPYLWYQMGRTLFNLRRFEEAAAWLEKMKSSKEAIGQNAALALHAHILASQVLDRLGRHSEAMSVLRNLIEADPDYGPGYYYLGRIYYSQGDYDEAGRCFQKFLDLGTGLPLVGLNPDAMGFVAATLMGRTFEKSGQRGRAQAAYRTAAVIDPNNPEPQLALARMAWEDGESSEARSWLARCLTVSPGNRRAADLMHEIRSNG